MSPDFPPGLNDAPPSGGAPDAATLRGSWRKRLIPRARRSDGSTFLFLPVSLFRLRSLWPWLVLGALTWLGWEQLGKVDVREVRTILRGTGTDIVLALFAATALNLIVAGLYDVVALGPLSREPKAGARWGVGVVSFAWSNFLTLGPLAGPALRLWLYKDLKVEGERSRSALSVVMVAFSLGLAGWCAAVTVPLPAAIDSPAVRLLMLLPVAGLIALVIGRMPRLRFAPEAVRRWEGSPVLLGLVASLDWALAWIVFHLALTGVHGDIGAGLSLRSFFVGQLVGLASFIPGGLGSAEAVWIYTLGDVGGGHDRIVSALILYRLVYYVVPWALATLFLAGRLFRTHARVSAFLRTVTATYTFVCGAVLLASAATPALADRVAFLDRSVPLALVEVSHGLSVALGFLMLVTSRGLARGYRSSHRMALAVFLAGAFTTFLKGLDFEEAILSLAAVAILLVFHRSFQRQGRMRPPVEFIVSVGLFAIVFFAAIGFGSESVPEASAIFNRFGYFAHGPRFLRGLLLLAALAGVVALHYYRRPAPRDRLPTSGEIDKALAEAGNWGGDSNALLIANGDKAIFRAGPVETGAATARTPARPAEGFIAFRTSGRFLVAWSDPVCPAGSERDLLASFVEYADLLDRDPILYEISAEFLPVAHDFGFNFFKLGEEAIVDLALFDLKGNKAKTWRHAVNRCEKTGGHFEILEGEALRPLLPDLRRVSDAWLSDKHIGEMRFSIGRFDEAYLTRFPCALVRDPSGETLAFANVLEGPRGEEMSVDLMRYRQPAQRGEGVENAMEYLFIRLMLHAKERGFSRFNLGMAPLSSVGEERHARPFEKLARYYSRMGGRWYNYQGLRAFKEKFDPSWEPRYMAYPRPWDWPLAIASTAALITGGWRALLLSKGESQ
jgi:phosphatidylglycerol lysyltransferase